MFVIQSLYSLHLTQPAKKLSVGIRTFVFSSIKQASADRKLRSHGPSTLRVAPNVVLSQLNCARSGDTPGLLGDAKRKRFAKEKSSPSLISKTGRPWQFFLLRSPEALAGTNFKKIRISRNVNNWFYDTVAIRR